MRKKRAFFRRRRNFPTACVDVSKTPHPTRLRRVKHVQDMGTMPLTMVWLLRGMSRKVLRTQRRRVERKTAGRYVW